MGDRNFSSSPRFGFVTDLAPTSRDHQHVDLGSDTFVLSAKGQPLRFTPLEKKFLVALDECHDLNIAAERIGKTLDWAHLFFRKPKIFEWMTKIGQEESARQGMTIRWLRAQLMAVYLGRETYWEGECSTCHVKQKSWIEPDDLKGVLSSDCLACKAPVLMNEMTIPVKKDRQQMVALQELSARIDPKVERVSHEFSDENFVFRAKESD